MTAMLMKIHAAFTKCSYWVLPQGIEAVLEDELRLYYALLTNGTSLFSKPHLRDNSRFRDIHAGQRCFILGNAPSILKEDLTPLHNDICFGVSNFYKHPSYSAIRPKYHCVPNIEPHHAESDTVKWLTEMHTKTLDATMFLSFRQKSLVRNYRLFPDRSVHYLLMEAVRPADDNRIQKLTGNILNPQSVPIMCLIIALYMGFSKIYLLGIDHDLLRTGVYNYFYDRKEMLITDRSVASDGSVVSSRLEDFLTQTKLWRQYLLLHTAAKRKGVDIINLNKNSYLDVFPFSTLKETLKGQPGQGG